jgi:hypothetical protein
MSAAEVCARETPAAVREPSPVNRSPSASTIHSRCFRRCRAPARHRQTGSIRSSSRCSNRGRRPAPRNARRSREAIFNIRHFVIDGVPGLNGRPQDAVSGPIAFGTCTVCHDTPNAGNHSVSLRLDIGLTDITRRTPDLPQRIRRHTGGHGRVLRWTVQAPSHASREGGPGSVFGGVIGYRGHDQTGETGETRETRDI